MSKVSPINYDIVVKALSKIGYVFHHKKGSHIIMHLADEGKYASLFGKRNVDYMVVVPAHKPIGRGMVRTIVRETGLSVDEFWKLL